MNFSLSDVITGLVTAVLTWISGRFFSLFRTRQLYLLIDHPMYYPIGNSRNLRYTVTVFNKGKEKESNVEISFPQAQSIKVLSSDYESFSIANKKLTIDRILSDSQYFFVVEVESQYKYSGDFLPIIKSDDKDGRCYTKLADVPASGATYVAWGAVFIFMILFFFLIPTVFKKSEEFINWYNYHEFNDNGFSFDDYTNYDAVDKFKFKGNDTPISLNSFDVNDGIATYAFIVRNNQIDNLNVNVSFIPRDEDSYTKEHNIIFDKFIYSDYDKYIKLNKSLSKKYFIYEGKPSKSIIPSMQSKKIEISRKVTPGMSMQDFNIKFRLKLESSEKYRDTVIIFSSQKNKEVNTILSSSFKSD
ncbi:hypothetical protein [Escherichia coli]|uniref:hypothetical protein n=1 Tax=Escherichia coli TaxID=562 RepID=UPI000BE7BBB7|nr:hypothetical protein [Escherichia coli]EET6513731.1 hypothetical protein [Escherichia coli]EEV7020495.1 hypothetical protein [Escherichia coli]EEX9449416.1 hypothetical protein [Escherichia coli]EFG1010718.1 hypothetical protein [Escherichia coli]EFG6207122.1 hypothetical protein [Escherichia coli]